MSIKHIIYSLFLLLSITLQAQSVLTKEEATTKVLENNFDIRIINNDVEVAKNNTSLLNTEFLPTLSGSAGATYNKDNIEAQFRDNTPDAILNGAESSSYNASIDLNYTIFDGLGRRYNYKRLKEQYQLSELQARETIENTILQMFTVYYSVAQLDANLKTLEETLDITKERLVRANYQFDYGQNTKLDVLNAEVDIATDTTNVISVKQQLTNAKRDLKVVLGETYDGDFDVESEVEFILGFNKEGLLAKAKARNVALLQAERNIAISRLDINSGKSGYLPTLDLIGSYGWNKNNNNAAAFVSTLINTGFSGGVSLSWNLFDGGATINTVRNAKINLETQKLQKESILLSIERDFYNAWDDYMNKLEIFNIQEGNIVTAQNNFDRTDEKFKIGQVNSIEFRQAQLNLLNAEFSRTQAKFDAKLAELTLLQISGEILNVKF